ncbi:YjfB family protein [Eubacteriales bacterium OttesenSCG-928-N14]|nr:YjfB family protein [Eubacteriales bacterium OttesenSCG-928-N14]
MDIAALSIAMNQSKVEQQFSIGMLKKTMDMQKELAQMMVEELIVAAPQVSTGHVDTYA